MLIVSVFEEIPSDPVSLAAVRAEQSVNTDGIEATVTDHLLLAELDHVAEQLGFPNNRYFVESHRSIVTPASFDADQPTTIVDFFGLTFEGEFVTYAKLHIGRIIGAGAVRAVCLVFTNARLLPYLDKVPSDKLLYTPVLAVESIEQVS